MVEQKTHFIEIVGIVLLATTCLHVFSLRAMAEEVPSPQAGPIAATRPAATEKKPPASFEREHPFLFSDSETFVRANARAGKYPWAAMELGRIVGRAYGVLKQPVSIPPEGGQWSGHYVCKKCNTHLKHKDGKHVCTKCGKAYTGWPYDQVIYGSRHSRNFRNVQSLGLAYALTGKEKYAKKAREILLGYAEKYPTYKLHDHHGRADKSSARLFAQTLDEAVKIIPAVWGYDLVYNSPCFSAEDRRKIETDLFRGVAKTVRGNHKSRGNWQSWHNAALMAIGFCLRDRKIADYAVEGLRFQLKNSIGRDGFWYEGTPAYHFYALGAVQYAAEMAHYAGIDIYKEPRLKGLYEAPILYTFPDMTFPAVGDSDIGYSIGRYGAWYDLAYSRFGDSKFLPLAQYGKRKSFFSLLWGAEKLPPATNLTLESRNFPELGAAVLRQGNGADQLYVHLDYNTPDKGHGHPDKLSIILFGLGRQLAPDPGRGWYLTPLHYKWYRRAFAHNTVCVDSGSHQAATGKSTMFKFQPGFAIAQACCDTAWAGVKMKRTVALTESYLIDIFSVTSDKEHTYDWVYHNFGKLRPALPVTPHKGKLGEKSGYQHMKDITRAKTDEAWSADFKQSGANVRLTMLGLAGTEIYFGMGMANRPPRPCPMLVARRKGKTTTFISIIEPYKKTPAVTGLRTIPVAGDKNAIALEITRGDKKDIFMLTDRVGLERRFGGIKTRARACFALDVSKAGPTKIFNIK